MNRLPRISEESPEHQKDEPKFDVMKQQYKTDSSHLGHFERKGEIRFHPTKMEKAGGIHVAAEKAREAQQKFEQNLKSGHKKDEHILKKEDSYEERENERAKREAHNINEAVNKQIHQKCYEAQQEMAASIQKDFQFVDHIY